MNTLTPGSTQERLGKDAEALKVMTREELHGYLIAELDLEKIDTEVESLGYLVLKKKDETSGIYSLRTHSLLPFPGSGGGKSFLKLSGAETDKEKYVYMSVGGVETADDVMGILAFFTLKDDIIEEHKIEGDVSLIVAISVLTINKMARNINQRWVDIQDSLIRSERLLEGINQGNYHLSNNTIH